MSANLGFGDYLKAAFRWKTKIPGLGAMPLNAIGLGAFAVAGIANPGFLLLGVALELAYLVSRASSERFQKLVQAEMKMAERLTFEEQLSLDLSRLSPRSRDRYHRLLDLCRRAVANSEALGDAQVESLKASRNARINQLLQIFVRLLISEELLEDTLHRVDEKGLKSEIGDLERRLAETSAESPLYRSINGTLEIQKKRLENFGKADENHQVVQAELERIEQNVVLISEEAAIGGRTIALSDRLEAVTSALSETNRWMEQNADIFSSLESDSAPVPTALPGMPAKAVAEKGRK